MSRDPKIDPRAGDMVVSKAWEPPRERHVLRRSGNDIVYVLVGPNKTSAPKTCWITTWQDWCHNNKAETLQKGFEV